MLIVMNILSKILVYSYIKDNSNTSKSFLS